MGGEDVELDLLLADVLAVVCSLLRPPLNLSADLVEVREPLLSVGEPVLLEAGTFLGAWPGLVHSHMQGAPGQVRMEMVAHAY